MGDLEQSQNLSDIAVRLKNRRMECNMSYQDLADKTGMSKSTLQRYETGKINNIPLDKASILANALGVSTGFLMGWDREEKIANHINFIMTNENYKILIDKCEQMNENTMKRLIRYAALLIEEEKGSE